MKSQYWKHWTPVTSLLVPCLWIELKPYDIARIGNVPNHQRAFLPTAGKSQLQAVWWSPVMTGGFIGWSGRGVCCL